MARKKKDDEAPATVTDEDQAKVGTARAPETEQDAKDEAAKPTTAVSGKYTARLKDGLVEVKQVGWVGPAPLIVSPDDITDVVAVLLTIEG